MKINTDFLKTSICCLQLAIEVIICENVKCLASSTTFIVLMVPWFPKSPRRKRSVGAFSSHRLFAVQYYLYLAPSRLFISRCGMDHPGEWSCIKILFKNLQSMSKNLVQLEGLQPRITWYLLHLNTGLERPIYIYALDTVCYDLGPR